MAEEDNSDEDQRYRDLLLSDDEEPQNQSCVLCSRVFSPKCMANIRYTEFSCHCRAHWACMAECLNPPFKGFGAGMSSVPAQSYRCPNRCRDEAELRVVLETNEFLPTSAYVSAVNRGGDDVPKLLFV